MFAVAVAELAGDLETEAEPLADVLGVSAYDVKLRLAGVLPHVVFQSPSEEEALRVLGAIRARGHGVLSCDTRDVVASGDMIMLHRFALEETALLANGPGSASVAYDDLAVIVLTSARTDVVRATREKELVPRGGRPPATVEVDQTRHEHIVEHAAYLFPRGVPDQKPPRPWLLHEHEARYGGLGRAMRATQHDNFYETLSLIRGRASAALYDDRFSARPIESAQFVLVRGRESAVAELTDASKDLAVHLLATWLMRPRTGPYR